MKKLLLLFTAAALLVMLGACATQTQDPQPPTEITTQITAEAATEAPQPAEIALHFEDATDELLASFDQVHEIVVQQDTPGASIVFWADAAITNVTRIGIEIDNWEADWSVEGTGYRPVMLEDMAVVEQLPSGQAVVFRGHMDGGTFPVAGVAFVDENGAQRYFAVQANNAYGNEPGMYRWARFEIFRDRNVGG